MFVEHMINAAMTEFKQKMEDSCANMDLSMLTADVAEHLCGSVDRANGVPLECRHVSGRIFSQR